VSIGAQVFATTVEENASEERLSFRLTPHRHRPRGERQPANESVVQRRQKHSGDGGPLGQPNGVHLVRQQPHEGPANRPVATVNPLGQRTTSIYD
jgi:hypothetical protein